MIALKDMRKHLDLGADREDDVRDITNAVVATFEREASGLFSRRVDHVEEFTVVEWKNSLWLELAPIESITSVEVRSLGALTWTTLDATGYMLAGERRLMRVNANWSSELVRVTYTGGYTAEPQSGQNGTPSDILEALRLQAKYSRKRTSDEHLILASQAIEGASTNFLAADFHPTFTACVHQHRRLVAL